MVNIGAYWANRGETVLMIDMDLSAPGLSYSPLLGDYLHAEGQGKGFSDLLAVYYQGRNKNPNQLHFMPPHLLMREVYPPDKNGIPLKERRWERGGRLLAIGAGTAPIPQQENSQKISPKNASSHADGPKSLTIIKDIPPEDGRGEEETLEEFSLRALAFAIKEDLNAWRENDRPIDRVLIDCRTGLPELLELSLGYLSSRMVMVAGLNEQNREGMHQLLAALQKRIPIGEFPGVLRVVFSPVPRTDDEDNVVAALADNKKLLKSLMRTDPRNDEQESPPTISLLHYTPRLATGDVPLVTTHPHLLYAQEVREIAKWLGGDFRTASVIEGFKDRLDETGNFLKPEGLTGLVGSATTRRSNPLVGLPRWFWPLPREIREHTERRTQKCNELITFHPDINVDKDVFLTKLSWSVFLDASAKQQIIRKAESLSQEQVDQLLDIFDEERQKFASLEEARWEALLSTYWHHQKDWAEVVAGPDGVKQFLTAPLAGEILHPSWELWPIYWANIADALSKQDPVQAERAYQRAVAADPNHVGILGNFAVFMTKIRKDHDQAEQLFQRAIAADPNDAINLGNFADFMTDIRKNHDQAEQLYQRAVAADPNHASVLGNFAIFVENIRKNHDQAEQLYQRAVATDQNDETILCNFALFNTDIRKNHDQAEQLYQRAIAADPNHATALGNFALFMTDIRKDHDQAEQLYQRAIAADPNHANNLGNFASFMTDIRKDHDQALQLYQHAMAADPNHATVLGNFAIFMTNIRKNHDQAEQLYQRAIAINPNHANNLGSFANFMTNIQKDHDQAEQLYQRAIAADPNDANNLCNFVSFLLVRKRREEGLERLRAAFNLSPLRHQFQLELLYYATTHAPDRYPEALVALKRLILDGVRSPGWDLSGHVAIAREQND
ncbi:MAG: tetratricopeptide repeat protein, partial [Nitrospirae bacterium]|nr:tetratricopeptide repeat protein [Magnetococcales bacterium]